MNNKKNVIMGVAALLIAGGAVALFVLRMGGEPEGDEPIVLWVCDRCGHTADLPHENKSPDCPNPKCTEGQMIERVHFRCKKCMKVFEAYQTNWSPYADRAEAKRKEADEFGPLPEGLAIPKGYAQLVRRPGGKWAWTESQAGTEIMTQLSCPNCGDLSFEQFEKVTGPSKKK